MDDALSDGTFGQLSPTAACDQHLRMGLTTPLIAIINDDEGIRRALRRLVRTLHYEPVAFASGEEFLESLAKRRPGCVLMDLHLPGLSGIEVLERMRDGDQAPSVIVMTGFDEPGTRESCFAAGAAGYLTKPIEAAHLSAALSRALQSQ